MSPTRKFILGAVCLAPLVGVPVGSRLLSDRIAASAPEARFLPDGEARLLADLEHSRDLGFFAGLGTERDAAPVLNHLVRADGEMDGTTPAWWAEHGAFADLAALKKEDNGWLVHPEVTDRYDLSFLAEWRAFDHWNWAAAPPFSTHLVTHPDICPMAAPIPNYTPFSYLAKVRMAQGYASGNLADAMADVEHLALLAYSTETMVGAWIGVAILGIEDRAIERALADGKVAAAPPRAWNASDIKRLKYAMMASVGAFTVSTNSELSHTLVANARTLPGVCAGLAEAVIYGTSLRPYVADPWPGEVDHSALVAGLEDALTRSGCAASFARWAWANPASGEACTADGSWIETRAATVPYLRAPVVALMRSATAPNFLGPYGNEP